MIDFCHASASLESISAIFQSQFLERRDLWSSRLIVFGNNPVRKGHRNLCPFLAASEESHWQQSSAHAASKFMSFFVRIGRVPWATTQLARGI